VQDIRPVGARILYIVDNGFGPLTCGKVGKSRVDAGSAEDSGPLPFINQ
jgi:hypothetical protein